MASLQQAAQSALNDCFMVKKGEKVLVVTDKNMKKIGEIFFEEARKITQADLISIPVGKVSGSEPPEKVAQKMLDYDVLIMPTTKSLTHTKAVREARDKGARGATLPGITEETMMRCICVDYVEMQKYSNKLKSLLDKAKQVRVVSDNGTDLSFSVDGRLSISSAGWLSEKKKIGNLPSGETFIAPLENTADGKIVIDGSILNMKLDNPIIVKVENGFAVEFVGGEEADILRKKLESVNSNLAFNIAEFGIGTNKAAKIIGNTLEDEKIRGTCHFAFGNNMGFGGHTDVPIHIDGIVKSPTIYLDDKMVVKKGELF